MSISTTPVVHTDDGKVSKAERLGLVSPIAEVTDGRSESEKLADKLGAALKYFGYDIHPKANETPSLKVEEYLALRGLIQANGQLQPVLLFKGTLVDGRHRLMACYDLGIDPRTRQLPDGADLEAVIYDAEARRHQTKSQMTAFTVLYYEDKVRELTAAGEAKQRHQEPITATVMSPGTFVSQTAGISMGMANQAVALLNAGRVDLLIDVRDGTISSIEKAYQKHLEEQKGAEGKKDAGFIALNERLGKVGAAIQTLSNEVEKLQSLTYAVEGNGDLEDLITADAKFRSLNAGNAHEISKTLVPAGYEGSDREQRAAWMKEHAHLSAADWKAAYEEAFRE